MCQFGHVNFLITIRLKLALDALDCGAYTQQSVFPADCRSDGSKHEIRLIRCLYCAGLFVLNAFIYSFFDHPILCSGYVDCLQME